MGAESGRAIMDFLEDKTFSFSWEHRFLAGGECFLMIYPEQQSQELDSDCSLLWDFTRFWHESKKSVNLVGKKAKIKSLGVDTWGVDFALLDKNGMLVSAPFNYRDSRTDGMMEKAFRKISRKRIFELTGI
jgi:sugar (pentulose or hexulose) kinase